MTDPADESRFERAKESFFAGLASFQNSEFAMAERHFLASLDALPGRPSALVNLAATQLELARPGDALASADAALRTEPEGLDALLHRATALLRLGRFDEALPAFDRLLARDGDVIEGWFRRGQTLERLERRGEALASFARVLALDPTRFDAWSGSGTLLRELGRLDEAAHAFREALRHGADPGLHAYYLASVAGGAAPPTAPRDYVQTLFDDYAESFDRHLVAGLRYQAHTRLVDELIAVDRGPYRHALDLGCGTGLCGPLLRPLAERLTGLDLASRMLAKAATLAVYDALVQADAVDYLRRTDARFDLVVATDVFIYIGDLAPVFAAVRATMDRGVFCFTAEELAPGDGDFQLLPSLRYAHTEVSLRRLADAHGFAPIAIARGPVREDAQRTIPGLFVCLETRPS
jgi:predicted TPR repeat methyltransferase